MKINLEIIKTLNPCKSGLDNFVEHYPNFEGNHVEFLDLLEVPHSDKLWAVLRLMNREDIEVFAIECAVSAASSAYATSSASSAYAASSAASSAAYAATSSASSAYHAAAYAYHAAAYADTGEDAERSRQIEALIYLINKSEE